MTNPELVERAARLARSGDRAILGIAGAPASGKSTVAGELVDALAAHDVVARLVPMDGFHLADAALERLGRADRKGAPDTFDAHGYVALLRRLRDGQDHTVFAPSFERTLEQPIAGSIAVEPSDQLVVTEGNYLLVDEEPWRAVAPLLDEVWFCDLDEDERRRRLHARHVEFGRSADEASAWMAAVDDPNAALVRPTAARADLVIDRSD